MEFTLNDEQTQLQDSVRRWAERNYSFQQRHAIEQSDEGFSRVHWATMAELGWLAAAFPEDVGGLGGSIIDAVIVAEELGRALVLEPFLAVGILAAEALNRVGTDAQRKKLLPPILAGETMVALAHNESGSGGNVAYVETTADAAPDGWILRGTKSLVLAGPIANHYLISARTAGGANNEAGVTLFLVPPGRSGLVRRDYRTTDGQVACDLILDGVPVGAADVVGTVDGAVSGLRAAYMRAIVVLCADAVGNMDQALWTTRDYLRTRQQFGVPISTFQVLQHRAADMYVAVEQSRAAVQRAIAHLEDDDPNSSRRAASSAKVQIGRCGHYVCGQAIQLHGGIGVTEEYVIGHHFKRMMLAQQLFGHASQHLQFLAQAVGGVSGPA